VALLAVAIEKSPDANKEYLTPFIRSGIKLSLVAGTVLFSACSSNSRRIR